MNPDQLAYVYIMASSFKRLYIGVTTDLMHRIAEHKSKINPESHTAKYNINKLVYLERFTTITAAIQREKQLKGWLRTRKLDLVISNNPLWEDLSEDWGRPIPPFQESDLNHPPLFVNNHYSLEVVFLNEVKDPRIFTSANLAIAL